MEVLPFTSVTVQITVVVPKLNVNGALFVVVATAQLSFVVALPNEAVAPEVRLQIVTSAGAVISGASLSVTTTVCEQVDAVPPASVAVHTTVVVPNA